MSLNDGMLLCLFDGVLMEEWVTMQLSSKSKHDHLPMLPQAQPGPVSHELWGIWNNLGPEVGH